MLAREGARITSRLELTQSSVPLLPQVAHRSPIGTWPSIGFTSPTNAFCITLYNESRADLGLTLTSLARSISSLHRSRIAPAHSVICIVADGVQSLDPDVLSLFVELGITRFGPRQFRDGIDLEFSILDTSSLLVALGEREQVSTDARDQIHFILWLKEHNRGKLHSHVVFFSQLCSRMRPTFCYQIDAGTAVDDDAITFFVDHLQRNPRVAAVSPRVTPQPPSLAADFLCEWQFFDFSFRNGIVWSLEVAAGLLSVLPGQVSAYRWSALSSGPPNQQRDNGSTTPLAAYLSGASAAEPLKQLVYLAEDRVIGIELVFAQASRWKLDYLPIVKARTDSCQRFGELIRQRRRWNNSALACRVWLLMRAPRFLARADKSSREKSSLITAVAMQWVLASREFFAPSLLGALLMALSSLSANSARNLVYAFLLAVVLDGLLTIDGLMRGICGSKLMIWFRSISSALAGLLYLLLVATLPLAAALVLLAPALGLLPMLLVIEGRHAMTLARCQFSPIKSLAFSSILIGYSLWKLEDVSWGTKGLRRSSLDASARAKLTVVRSVMVVLWLLANALVLFAASTIPSTISSGLNRPLEIACIAEGAAAVLSATYIYLAMRKRLRRSESRCVRSRNTQTGSA